MASGGWTKAFNPTIVTVEAGYTPASRLCAHAVRNITYIRAVSVSNGEVRIIQPARPEPAVRAFDVEVVDCGSHTHLADIAALRGRHLAIPHEYSTWPLSSTSGAWRWCRVVDGTGDLLTGFSAHLTSSRAIPGARIARIDRVGRNLHEELADVMGAVLTLTARKISRLLRLDVRILDEDPGRRRRLHDSFAAAGWSPSPERRYYSHTLILQLAASHDEVLQGFSKRVRSAIKKAMDSPALRFEPLADKAYLNRLTQLYRLPFARTGGVPPPLDVEGVLHDSVRGGGSFLVGAFAREVPAPENLVAVLWGRLQGDHVVLEVNAADRSMLLENISPGFALMSELIRWGIQHEARWLDLGGLSRPDPQPGDPMKGIIEFKTRFSTDFREVAEEWHLNPNPLLAAAAVAVRSIAKSMSSSRPDQPERSP